MNDEIIFLHIPRYIYNKSFNLSDEELNELDELAKLMENPNDNFEKLQDIWNNNIKFSIIINWCIIMIAIYAFIFCLFKFFNIHIF